MTIFPSINEQNSQDIWLSLFPFPKAEGHKYDRGHALIYGGPVMTGATRLSARAAQRIGAGLVTLASPKNAVQIYAESLESVIVKPADDRDAWHELVQNPKHNTVLIGPGLGIGQKECDLVLCSLESKKPCVLDADALSNFANHAERLISKLHDQCIVTPHEGEFVRIFGEGATEGADKVARARAAAKKANCVILLKGAETVIASPEGRTVINTNAPPWLATAGAGDVLAGMILGLVTQKMPIFIAAAAAAWLHGQIATTFGMGLIAEDIVAGIPPALAALFKECRPTG